MKDLFIVRNKTLGTNTCYCATYKCALTCMARTLGLIRSDPKCKDWEYEIVSATLFEYEGE